MRVGIEARLTPDPHSGLNRVTTCLLGALAKVGTSHEYVAFGSTAASLGIPEETNVSHVQMRSGYFSLRNQFQMPRILKESRVDVIHFLRFATPWFCTVPLIATIHDLTYSRFPSLIPRKHRFLYKAFMLRTLTQARFVVCDSKCAAEDVHRFFPQIPSSKVRGIYLGVERRFNPREALGFANSRSSIGLPERYILYVGSHRPHKNVRRLVAAFSQMAKHIPHHLVLPSTASRDGEMTVRAVAEYGVTDRVVFHPMPDEVLPLIYGLADLFVFPSLAEGFGLPPVEAMACGTPVITSDASCLPEVTGGAAMLVDPYSVEAVADAMSKMMSDARLREEMASRGLERAKLFTWENTAREMLGLYEEALAS